MGRNGRGRPKGHVAANDNGANEARVRSAVLTIARLLGRQIAPEQFERQVSANDNTPVKETDRCDDRIRVALYARYSPELPRYRARALGPAHHPRG